MAHNLSRTALFSAFCISAIAISIAGCDTNALTRRSAEKIVNEHFHFPVTIYFYLREGEADVTKSRYRIESDAMEIIGENTVGELRFIRERPDDAVKILSVLDSLGHIQAKKVGSIQKSYDVDQYTISLTRKGKALFQKAPRKDREKENWWRMPLTQYGINQITGIALEGDNVTANVEFTLDYYDKTPIADLIAKRYLELKDRDKNSAVPMRKYDDGWRIEENRKRRW
ncbi:MAG: hypothetical protein ACRENG_00590 [bacterium]